MDVVLVLCRGAPGSSSGDRGAWEGDMRCSEVSLGRAVTLCLPTFLYPKAAFSLFIPLQGNHLIIIKMSEGIHKYIHTLNEELLQCTERHSDLWAPGKPPWFLPWCRSGPLPQTWEVVCREVRVDACGGPRP